MMRLSFVKMHGIGNDYVYLDAATDPALERLTEAPGWTEFVAKISDRRKGVGSDGVILVCRPKQIHEGNHARMRMFNADGSESEMCGNGVRCVAKFAHDRLGVQANPMKIETGRGTLAIWYELGNQHALEARAGAGKLLRATVDMGCAEFDPRSVPVDVSRLVPIEGARLGEAGLEAGGRVWAISCVSMGNPHAVCFVDSVASVDLERVGPMIERHAAFPRRVNFHVAEIVGRADRHGLYQAAKMRTWERGSGATLACGTGACAVFAAGVRTGRLTNDADGVTLSLPGGELSIRHSQAPIRPGVQTILMTGPAEDICEGVYLG